MRQTIILAGGKAERLRPLTDDRPKAMVKIAGRPIIEHQLRWLADNGVREVVVSSGTNSRSCGGTLETDPSSA